MKLALIAVWLTASAGWGQILHSTEPLPHFEVASVKAMETPAFASCT